jgi:uracil-DNA glycosylase
MRLICCRPRERDEYRAQHRAGLSVRVPRGSKVSMKPTSHRDHVIALARERIPELLNRSGAILYNGWSTVRPGRLYLMGLNPGGKPEQISQSIIDHLQSLHDDHCEYEVPWMWQNRCAKAGEHPHQKRVKMIVKCLSERISDVCAANAIFIRSCGAADLTDAPALFRRCWPVHELLLSIVRPKIIVALGNSNALSAFSLLQSRCQGPPRIHLVGSSFLDGKWFEGRLAALGHACTVVGVAHPSRVTPSEKLKRFLTNLTA